MLASTGPRTIGSDDYAARATLVGWNPDEVTTFRLCLMKFGLGKWTSIVESGALPGKTVGQMNNQMQRMIGQQSTKEFQGLHVDPEKVFALNKEKEGARKNGCLINTGANPTKEKVELQRAENRARFGLSQEEIDAIVIPMPKASVMLTDDERREKLARLIAMQDDLADLIREENGNSNSKPTKKTKKQVVAAEIEEEFEDFEEDSEPEFVPVKRRRASPTE